MTTMEQMFGTYPAWQDDAACALATDAFIGPNVDDGRAKQVCARCPVRVLCLDYALEHDERYGVWGGLTPRERDRLRGLRATPNLLPPNDA